VVFTNFHPISAWLSAAKRRYYASQVDIQITLGFASVAVILFCSFNLGAFILHKVNEDWDFFATYLSIALGMAAYSYTFTILGMANLLSQFNFLVLLVTSQILLLSKLGKNHLKFFLSSIRNLGRHSLWFTFILIVSISIHPLMTSFGNPIVGYDALAYHTYLPWFAMTDSHSLRTDLLVPNSGLSLGAQGIFGFYLSIFGYKFVNLINFFFLFATLHLVYLYAQNDKRVFRITKTIVALVVIISAGRIVVTSPSSDLALVFYACVSTMLAIRIVNSGYRLNSFWLFALGGFIFFIKPFGIILVAFLLFIVARSTKVRLTKFLAFLIYGFSISFSWAIYNYHFTGNPFFPLFQGFFKGIGFGPEVMTNEEDVRRSFTQTFTYLRSNKIDLFDLENAQLQIFFVVGITLLSVVDLLWNLLRKKSINFFVVSLNLTFLFLLLYIGPIFRYFIFISVLQIFFLFSNVYVANSQNIALKQKRNLKKVASKSLPKSLASGLVICLCLFSLQGTVAEYGVSDMEPPKPLLSSGITVNEEGFRNVIDFFAQENYEGSRLALLGEGRAALFYPKPTLVLPGDRRNPFFDPNVVTVSAIRSRLHSLDVDYLLISTLWGWPKNANLALLEDFKRVSYDSLVFTSEGWEVYEI
jgi:hypothetical protein